MSMMPGKCLEKGCMMKPVENECEIEGSRTCQATGIQDAVEQILWHLLCPDVCKIEAVAGPIAEDRS
jgi:hypothetical protein